MQKQGGNFLLQALLALTLVFSFMPFFASKLASRDMSAKMYAAKTSIETIHDAARLYLRDTQDQQDYGNTTYTGAELVGPFGKLTPYGLPASFNPVTALKQDISLVIHKEKKQNGNGYVVSAEIIATRGELTDFQSAELARMVGFFARRNASDGSIHVNVPVDVVYSDIVLRHETDEQIGFLVELDMGGHRIDNVNKIFANTGDLYKAKIKNMVITGRGVEDSAADIHERNVFKELNATKRFVFDRGGRSVLGENAALQIEGDLDVNTAKARSLGKYGAWLDNLNVSKNATLPGLGLLSASGQFTSTAKDADDNYITTWYIGNNLDATDSQINAADVTATDLDVSGGILSSESNGRLGVITNDLYATKIIFSSKTKAEIKNTGSSDSDRLASITTDKQSKTISAEFPEVQIEACSSTNCKASLDIVASPVELNSSETIKCQNILYDYFSINPHTGGLGSAYVNQLLTINILCQYLYLERAERRINQTLCKYGSATEGKCS